MSPKPANQEGFGWTKGTLVLPGNVKQRGLLLWADLQHQGQNLNHLRSTYKVVAAAWKMNQVLGLCNNRLSVVGAWTMTDVLKLRLLQYGKTSPTIPTCHGQHTSVCAANKQMQSTDAAAVSAK